MPPRGKLHGIPDSVPSRSSPQPWHDEADEPARRCLYVRKGEMRDAWKLKENLIVRIIFGYLILF